MKTKKKGADREAESGDDLLKQWLRIVPEWMVYGSWDAPRCFMCGGFKSRRSRGVEPGHKKGCVRVLSSDYLAKQAE